MVGGQPTGGRACPTRVAVTTTPHALMRREVWQWQPETSGDTCSYFEQPVRGVSCKNRLRRHLANPCRVKRHALAPPIAP